MGIIVLSNSGEYNHYNILTKYSKMADKIIIVSPFLAADMSCVLSEMPTIKRIELYTNLDGYGMAGNVLSAICGLYKYGSEKNVDVSVKYNDCLHGKAYLLYNGNESKGCIITSGNFTDNGLKNNHEYGVFLDNESMQEELRMQIYSLEWSELSDQEVIELLAKADEFAMRYSATRTPVFKAADYIKNRMILPDNCRFFLKVLGAEGRPIEPGYTIIKDNEIGFRKIPSRITKGDILVCHATKVSKVLGVCKILEIEPKTKANFDTDRWNQKLPTSCISEQYSSHWWDYDIRTLDLVAEYNRIKKEGEHITMAGGDTIKGCLQSGCFEITREFAQFVIDRISKA